MARSSALARVPLLRSIHAPAGAIVNITLRLAILAMSVDAIVNGADPRFAGKALAPRDIIIAFGFAMVSHFSGGFGTAGGSGASTRGGSTACTYRSSHSTWRGTRSAYTSRSPAR
jgi:hypothetical protein